MTPFEASRRGRSNSVSSLICSTPSTRNARPRWRICVPTPRRSVGQQLDGRAGAVPQRQVRRVREEVEDDLGRPGDARTCARGGRSERERQRLLEQRADATSGVTEVAPVAPPPAISPPAAATPKAGDGVRELGDTLAGTVQKTGDGVGAVAEPLGPPVSKAVQDVLNLAVKAINDLLMKTTGGLAGLLDKTAR